MDKNFSITVHFESYDDLLLLSKKLLGSLHTYQHYQWLKNTDVNRKSRAKGFRGDVEVSLGDVLQNMADSWEEDWDSLRQRRQELYTAVEESLN